MLALAVLLMIQVAQLIQYAESGEERIYANGS